MLNQEKNLEALSLKYAEFELLNAIRFIKIQQRFIASIAITKIEVLWYLQN